MKGNADMKIPVQLKQEMLKKLKINRGAWVTQSVKHLTSAQVMILWFVDSSHMSGSVLTAQSLELV